MFFGNVDTIVKYLGLELSLGVGLCGRDVVSFLPSVTGLGRSAEFFICAWPCSKGNRQ